jgi:hypothetical protein
MSMAPTAIPALTASTLAADEALPLTIVEDKAAAFMPSAAGFSSPVQFASALVAFNQISPPGTSIFEISQVMGQSI